MNSFFDNHGILFLFGVTIFPRITTLFFMTTPFGLLAWLGWIFTPHLLVAVYATMKYWQTNPVLVVIAWIVACSGTGAEGKVVTSRKKGLK